MRVEVEELGREGPTVILVHGLAAGPELLA